MGRFLIPPLALLIPAAWAAWTNPWFLDDGVTFGAAVLALAAAGRLLPKLGAAGPALAWTFCLAVLFRPTPPRTDTGMLVFGLDGATWDVVDTLQLPQIEGLQQQGISADLHSMEPMLSPILWTTMATGRLPGDHGIVGFRTRSEQVKVPRFWDIAKDAGQRVGLYKWLVTWPPDPATTFTVPAWLSGDAQTHPSGLGFIKEIELSNRLHRMKVETARTPSALAIDGARHGLRWSTLLRAGGWTLESRLTRPDANRRAHVLQLLRMRMDRDTFIWTLHNHPVDLATFTTYAIDALGHSHWSAPNTRGAVADAMHLADRVLGDILQEIADDAVVVVLSDHGFRTATEADAHRHHRPTTRTLQRLVAASVEGAQVARVGTTLVLTSEDVARVLAFVAELRRASTGQPLYDWEPLDGQTVALTLRDHTFSEALLAADRVGDEPLTGFVEMTAPAAGEHDVRGIWLLRASGVSAGETEPLTLLDVAPTLLGLLGLPAAQDMPGEVRFGTVHPRVKSWGSLAPRKVGPAPDVEDRLRALGYIE